MAAVATDVRRRAVLADVLPGALTRDIALVLASAGFVGLAAQLSLPMPGTPVPVTLQTFAVLLVGASLGPARAFAGLALYLLAGGAGVPWFADQSHGFGGASFGYIIGFVVAGTMVGWLARRGGDRTPARTAGTMLLGTLVIYVFGVPWLAASVDVSLWSAIDLGVSPFLAGDVLKVLLAAGLLPGTWALVRRTER